MSTTITRSKMFTVFVSVDEARLSLMKKSPELANKALQHGADFWHSRILPRHFDKPAHDRYGYAPRTRVYSRLPAKGQKPDLVLSGSLRQDLRARASYVATGSGGGAVELKMTARVLNFVPNMAQNSSDLYIKQRNGRGYPNLKREIKLLTDDERESTASVIVKNLEMAFAPSESPHP